jgi:TATA-box binding protein (TBP) (component of TFIID and TFIIIB)
MKYSISTITLNTIIDHHINLYDVATFLPIDDDILGYKYKHNNDIITKGIFKVNNTTKKFFNNQLTLKIKYNNRIINVKMFNNGSFNFTGCTNQNDGDFLTRLIIKKINNINSDKNVSLKRIENVLIDTETNIIYDNSYNTMGYKLELVNESCYKINNASYIYHEKRNIFISHSNLKTKTVLDINGNNIGYCKIKMLKGSKLYKNNKVTIDLQNDNVLFMDTIIANIIYYTSDSIIQLSEPINFKYKPMQIKINNIVTKINCINACFKLSCCINRNNITCFLKENNYIVTFNPDIYSGVKFTYKQNNKMDGKCHCKDKCVCNHITFLIFESGNVISTNYKNINDIQYIIDFFNNLIIQTKYQLNSHN